MKVEMDVLGLPSLNGHGGLCGSEATFGEEKEDVSWPQNVERCKLIFYCKLLLLVPS